MIVVQYWFWKWYLGWRLRRRSTVSSLKVHSITEWDLYFYKYLCVLKFKSTFRYWQNRCLDSKRSPSVKLKLMKRFILINRRCVTDCRVLGFRRVFDFGSSTYALVIHCNRSIFALLVRTFSSFGKLDFGESIHPNTCIGILISERAHSRLLLSHSLDLRKFLSSVYELSSTATRYSDYHLSIS